MNLPQSRYQVTDPAGKHKYQIEIPGHDPITGLKSVTTVLGVISKPALYAWYAKTACDQIHAALQPLVGQRVELTQQWVDRVVAEGRKRPTKVKDEAAELGTMAHAAFDEILAGKEPKVPDQIRSAVDEFRKWFAASGIEVVASELAIGSAEYQFGGRIDAIGYRNGQWGILDWKTGAGIYGEYALQTAGGYAIALEEQFPGIKVEWVDIVRFAKKEPWGSEVRPVADMENARRGFLDALDLCKALEVPMIGEASYSTFAENSAAADDLREKARQKKKSIVGF